MTINAFVNTTRYQNSSNTNGAVLKEMSIPVAITAAGNLTGDILRLCTLPTSAIITEVLVGCTAITDLDDADLGVYETLENGGAAINADCFMDGQTLETASKVLNGLGAVAVADLHKDIKDLESLTASKYVDIALTLKATPSVDGSINVKITYIM